MTVQVNFCWATGRMPAVNMRPPTNAASSTKMSLASKPRSVWRRRQELAKFFGQDTLNTRKRGLVGGVRGTERGYDLSVLA